MRNARIAIATIAWHAGKHAGVRVRCSGRSARRVVSSPRIPQVQVLA
jgi:hypothetical protein